MRKLLTVTALLAMAAVIVAPAQAAKDTPWTEIIAGYQEGALESFSYYSESSYGGPLNGQGPWTGSATGSIILDWNELLISANHPGAEDANWSSIGYNPAGDIIVVGIKMAAGSGTDFMYDFEAYDTNNVQLGRFYGKPNSARGRNTLDQVTDEITFAGDPYTPVYMVINTASNMTEFFVNGTSAGSLSYANGGDTLGKITLRGWGRSSDQGVWMDNLTYGTIVVPEPSSLAALGMFGLGGLGFLRRRRA